MNPRSRTCVARTAALAAALAGGAAMLSGCQGLEHALEAIALAILIVVLAAAAYVALSWVAFFVVLFALRRKKDRGTAIALTIYASILVVQQVALWVWLVQPTPELGWFVTESEAGEAVVASSIVPWVALMLASSRLVGALRPAWATGAKLAALAGTLAGAAFFALALFLSRAPLGYTGTLEELSVETIHACGRLSTGAVVCTGANWDGQLGNGADGNAQGPVYVRGIDDARLVTVGDGLSCALRASGEAWCWGGHAEHHRGAEKHLLPWRVPGGTGVADVHVDRDEILLLHRDGRLTGWPTPAPPLSGVATIDVEDGDTCAALRDGTVTCWEIRDAAGSRSYRVEGLDGVVDVSAASSGGCAVRVDRTLWCWSRYSEGPASISDQGVGDLVEVVGAWRGYATRSATGVVTYVEGHERRVLDQLAGATRLDAPDSTLCASRDGAPPACVDLTSGEVPDDAQILLSHDRR